MATTPRYQALPHDASPPASERDGAGEGENEGDHLLSGSPRNSNSFVSFNSSARGAAAAASRPWSITFAPSMFVRTLSSIFCLTGAIIMIVEGGRWFIVADMFLLLIVTQNVVQFLVHLCSLVFRIRLEYHGQVVGEHSLALPRLTGPSGAPFPLNRSISLLTVLDVVLCFAAYISILGEGARYGSHVGRYWYAYSVTYKGVIVAYCGLIFHILLAIPGLDRNTITLTARINRSPSSSQSHGAEDVKFASSVAASALGVEDHHSQQSGVVNAAAPAAPRSGGDIV
ncbi:hypothetical protein PVAG01_08159 [Phlyctema vagabunda]|uniref:Uncharacterized protein n=1 Tax=Phlyctema vagabunda TaxID=108571 RepID=A0ABR4P9A0_9HELO